MRRRALIVPVVLGAALAFSVLRDPPPLPRVLIGDVTNDGLDDVVRVTASEQGYSILIEEGDLEMRDYWGDYQTDYRVIEKPIASEKELRPQLLAIGDFTGDGLNDVLYAQEAGGLRQYTLLVGVEGLPREKLRLSTPPEGF